MRGLSTAIAITLGLAVVSGVPISVNAAPIVYSFEGTGSGSVGSTPLSNTPFRIRVSSDTTNVSTTHPYTSVVAPPGAEIEINGVGTGVFQLNVSVNRSSTVITFGDHDLNLLLIGLFAGTSVVPPFYDLTTDFGPVTDTAPTTEGQFVNIPLDIGPLTFSSLGPVSFQSSIVPEPSTALLVMTGLVGMAVRQRRHR